MASPPRDLPRTVNNTLPRILLPASLPLHLLHLIITSFVLATTHALAREPAHTTSLLRAIATANPTFNKSWGMVPADDPCTWRGVACEGGTSLVTSLDLSHSQLSGPVPWRELLALRHLTRIDLRGNSLTGPVPAKLLALRSLDVSDNFLNGTAPDTEPGNHSEPLASFGMNCFGLSEGHLYRFGMRGAAACAAYYPGLAASCGFCDAPLALAIDGTCRCVKPTSLLTKFRSNHTASLGNFSVNLLGTLQQIARALDVEKEQVAAISFTNDTALTIALTVNILPGGRSYEMPAGFVERVLPQINGNATLGPDGLLSPLFESIVRVPYFYPGIASMSAIVLLGAPALPPPPTPHSTKGDPMKLIIVAAPIITALLVVGFGMAYTIIQILRFCRRRKRGARKIISGTTVKSWTFDELWSATRGFSQNNILGKGGFGTVYRGVLEGRPIAVKRCARGSSQGQEELAKEVETMGSIHHRNLVELQGYCIEGEEYILVYNLMANGSVEDWLFGRDLLLSWPVCVNIIMGTANAIAYLHTGCKEKIIHRDIKPGNILLDAHFEAHVADFGMARVALSVETHVSTRVMGTMGYVAPEYASTGQLTEKSDVFSFGMVMLVILSHRKALDIKMADGSFSLVDRVIMLTQEDRLLDLIAPHFAGTYDEDEALRLIFVAILCIQHVWQLRPSMDEVRQFLHCSADIPRAKLTKAMSTLWDGYAVPENRKYDGSLLLSGWQSSPLEIVTC